MSEETHQPSEGHEQTQSSLVGVARVTANLRTNAVEKTKRIQHVTGQMKILALNAMIEAARAGDAGRGFSVVAQEVRAVGSQVESFAKELEEDLAGRIADLQRMVEEMAERSQGERLVDLALNAVELIDRNLYERTCDVRWWATDSAVVECASSVNNPEHKSYTSQRLGVILDSYTVYLDLWLCDLNGSVLANGRPDRYQVQGTSISDKPWFRNAKVLKSGDEYVVADVDTEGLLGGSQVATYATCVREGGRSEGAPIGVLAVHFDWATQARQIVEGVRLSNQEKAHTRALLLDANRRVIAASDGVGVLSEKIHLDVKDKTSGYYRNEHGSLVAYHATPGYESYRGLGWYGAIVQQLT